MSLVDLERPLERSFDGRAVVPLEPWTVYGRLVAVPGSGCQATLDVLDIGFLPPPGLYAGTLVLAGGRASVVFTVPARSPVETDDHRRLRLEVAPGLTLPGEGQVALTVRGLIAVRGPIARAAVSSR